MDGVPRILFVLYLVTTDTRGLTVSSCLSGLTSVQRLPSFPVEVPPDVTGYWVLLFTVPVHRTLSSTGRKIVETYCASLR